MNAHAAAVIAMAHLADDYAVQAEPLSPNLAEFLEVLGRHLPADDHPFDPQVAMFEALDAAGRLAFVALRGPSGRLKGCTLSHVHECPHYSFTTGATDVLIVPPGLGAARATSALLAATEAELKRRGVLRWFLREGLDAPHACEPSTHGFRPVEQQHVMALES